LLRARIAANESSAAHAVRMLNSAEVSDAQAHQDNGFTCSPEDLRKAGLIGERLAMGTRNGYIFRIEGCGAHGAVGGNKKYQILAFPVTFNRTGVREFCSDESGIVRSDQRNDPQPCLEQAAPL
jgi:hypothetical protein